jgi:hypothetical protein
VAAALLVGLASAGAAQAQCLAVPGDVNSDGFSNVVDAQCTLLTVLYQLMGSTGPAPACLKGAPVAAADINCTGQVDVVDVQVIITFVLTGSLPSSIDGDDNSCVDNCQQESDQAPPVIAITSPLPETLLAAPKQITVTGTVSDESSVSVSVKGVAATIAPDGTWQAVNVPLVEGQNTLTATAIDQWDNSATASVLVRLDTTPPLVTIETPPAGAVLAGAQVDVAGLVNDLVEGTTIQGDDVTVTVNGVQAMVSNRAWVVPGLLLHPGQNTLSATARDGMNNAKTVELTVTVDDEAGQRLVMVSGNAQVGLRGAALPAPLVVSLEDAKGDPIVGREVQFEVVRGEGKLMVPTVPPSLASSVTVTSDDDGLAQARFVLGQRAGGGNHRVRVTAPGFVGLVEFCFAVEATAGARITAEMGGGQLGAPGAPLPMPLTVLVTDAGGNCAEGAPVTFQVVEGGGNIDGQTSITVPTNSDGTASVYFTLGPDAGSNNNIVVANIPGNTEGPATFRASAEVPGLAYNTTVSGVVLTNEDVPMPNVWAYIKGTNPLRQAFTDAEGNFTITQVPVGSVHLHITGATTPLPGVWPDLEYEVHTVAGRDNTVGMPIYLPTLDKVNARVVGGPEDVVITQDGMPGASLTVYANSVTCPDGSKSCEVSWSQVNMERVPMPAPLGSTFMLAWTVQPSGTHFDPPARVCIPSTNMPPGMQREVYSFDHDLEAWVVVGTATVSADGQQICSDPGFGVVKAGWGGPVPPPPPKKCSSNCDDKNDCTTDVCEAGSCVHLPISGNCTDDGNSCTFDVCIDGVCTHNGKPTGTDCGNQDAVCGGGRCEFAKCTSVDPTKDGQPCNDGKFCTENDTCKFGGCSGTPIKYNDVEITPVNLNITEFAKIFAAAADGAKTITPCDFPGPTIAASFTTVLKNKCCEAEQIKKVEGTEFKGSLSLSVGFECMLASYPPLPPAVAQYFGVSLNVGAAIGVQVEASGERDACTGGKTGKMSGAINGDLTLTVVGTLGGGSVLKVYGGAKTGASGGVECANNQGKWYAKWNGVTLQIGYTVAGFIDKNVAVKIADDVPLGEHLFPCELPF